MHLVYALCDPRTGAIRYVGQSADIHRRYAQHLLQSADGRKKAWLEELKALNMLPTLVVLESDIQAKQIFEREQYWIQQSLTQGWDLTNGTIGALVNGPKPKVKKKKPPKRGTGSRLYSMEEVIKLFGWSDLAANHYLSSGQLRGVSYKEGWYINQENLDFFIDEMRRWMPSAKALYEAREAEKAALPQ